MLDLVRDELGQPRRRTDADDGVDPSAGLPLDFGQRRCPRAGVTVRCESRRRGGRGGDPRALAAEGRRAREHRSTTRMVERRQREVGRRHDACRSAGCRRRRRRGRQRGTTRSSSRSPAVSDCANPDTSVDAADTHQRREDDRSERSVHLRTLAMSTMNPSANGLATLDGATRADGSPIERRWDESAAEANAGGLSCGRRRWTRRSVRSTPRRMPSVTVVPMRSSVSRRCRSSRLVTGCVVERHDDVAVAQAGACARARRPRPR